MPRQDDNTPQSERTIISVSDPAVQALLPRYLERRRADVLRITGLLAAGNFADIRVLAHNMRGSGAAYGLDIVTAIGTKIEHAARSDDAAGIDSATRELSAFLDTASCG